MNPKNSHQFLTTSNLPYPYESTNSPCGEVDQHNLALLAALYEVNADFASYAKSINELFYYYVQHCSSQGDDFFLTPTDVHSVLDVVNLLQQLKEPVPQVLHEE